MPKLLVTLLVLSFVSAPVFAAPVSGQGTWETTLEARFVTGNPFADAYYDSALDITWYANGNYAKFSGFDADGKMDWDTAVDFVALQNTGSGLLGLTNWRLPDVIDIGAPGCDEGFLPPSTNGGGCGYNVDPTTGEMAWLFYETLGNLAFFDPSDGSINQPGYGLSNTGPFFMLEDQIYWSGTQSPDVGEGSEAWYFGMPVGSQRPRPKSLENGALLVVDGDPFAVVPVPAAVWLFGSALGLLGFIRRRL